MSEPRIGKPTATEAFVHLDVYGCHVVHDNGPCRWQREVAPPSSEPREPDYDTDRGPTVQQVADSRFLEVERVPRDCDHGEGCICTEPEHSRCCGILREKVLRSMAGEAAPSGDGSEPRTAAQELRDLVSKIIYGNSWSQWFAGRLERVADRIEAEAAPSGDGLDRYTVEEWAEMFDAHLDSCMRNHRNPEQIRACFAKAAAGRDTEASQQKNLA